MEIIFASYSENIEMFYKRLASRNLQDELLSKALIVGIKCWLLH